MEEDTSSAVRGEIHACQRSLLSGRSLLSDLPAQPLRERLFRIRAAETQRERSGAHGLVSRMYSTRGYQTATSSVAEEVSHRKTFLASDHGVAVGTLTIGLDNAEGLVVEQLFRDEVSRLRSRGRGVCEFTKLAVDRRVRSPRVLAGLFHVAHLYSYRIRGLQTLLIEVNPRHVRYYEAMLGFEVICTERHNPRVDAPAVLLALNLEFAQAQIEKFGGRPELASTERSAYPHFFPADDEEGLIDRLQCPNVDIATIVEPGVGHSSPAEPRRPVH